MTEGWTPSGRIRPSRWAWTTATATVLLALLLFAALTLGSDYADVLARRPSPLYPRSAPGVLSAFERGFAIALVPTLVLGVVARRLRRRGSEVDETVAAVLGILAVVVLALGLALALLHIPEAQGTRLTLVTALAVIGGAFLVASVWIRHVPRPWWPRGDVRG